MNKAEHASYLKHQSLPTPLFLFVPVNLFSSKIHLYYRILNPAQNCQAKINIYSFYRPPKKEKKKGSAYCSRVLRIYSASISTKIISYDLYYIQLLQYISLFILKMTPTVDIIVYTLLDNNHILQQMAFIFPKPFYSYYIRITQSYMIKQ